MKLSERETHIIVVGLSMLKDYCINNDKDTDGWTADFGADSGEIHGEILDLIEKTDTPDLSIDLTPGETAAVLMWLSSLDTEGVAEDEDLQLGSKIRQKLDAK